MRKRAGCDALSMTSFPEIWARLVGVATPTAELRSTARGVIKDVRDTGISGIDGCQPFVARLRRPLEVGYEFLFNIEY